MLLLLAHQVACFNITHFYVWSYDAHTKEAMKMIRAASSGEIHKAREVKIGINWLFEPATNYYIFKDKLYWIDWTTRSGPDGEYSYYYFRGDDKDIINKRNLKIVKYFPVSDSYFALPGALGEYTGKE